MNYSLCRRSSVQTVPRPSIVAKPDKYVHSFSFEYCDTGFSKSQLTEQIQPLVFKSELFERAF